MQRASGADGEGPEQPDSATERACFRPAALDWRIVLIDTPDVVCYLDDVRVYPSSCWFQVHSLLKPSAARAREVFTAADFAGPEPAETADFDTAFLLGVEYQDGRRSSMCVDFLWLPFETSAQPPILRSLGGTRTDGDADAEIVLEGLPEKGSVTFHARWTALGAPESTFELDGAVLRAAAERAVELWPAGGFSSPGS